MKKLPKKIRRGAVFAVCLGGDGAYRQRCAGRVEHRHRRWLSAAPAESLPHHLASRLRQPAAGAATGGEVGGRLYY